MAKIDINDISISQNNNTLVPFVWNRERGIEGSSINSDLGFSIQTKNIEYQDLIDGGNAILISGEKTETIYVPNDDSFYKYNSKIYVDVVSNSEKGISGIRAHSEPNAYDFENPENVYNIPVFSWSDSAFSNSNSLSTTTTTTPIGYDCGFWAGLDSNVLTKVGFNTSVSIIENEFSTDSKINYILNSEDSNKIYVSEQSNLKIYNGDKFLNSSEYSEYFSLGNNDNSTVIVSDDVDCVWGVESYNGKITKMDKDDLSEIASYSGFDAPFKVLRSEYHNCYFVVGRHILWKFKDGIKENIYQIGEYWIEDADISDNGEICLLFKNGTNNVIRVLSYNLYDFYFDIRLDSHHNIRFCKYCNNNFSVLDELDIEGFEYIADCYIFNLKNRTYDKIRIENALTSTQTTTTLPNTTDAILMQYPNGEEYFTNGETYEIKWASDKALTDQVKIELYKNGYYDSTIADSVQNSGVYSWVVPRDISEGLNYKIRITWLAGTSASNYDESNSDFYIVPYLVETTTTTTTKPYSQYAIGLDYDSDNNRVVVLLRSGLFNILSLNNNEIYGLIDSGIGFVSCFALSDNSIDIFGVQIKARLFVGSQEGYSDKWDSGIVETRLQSMLYGGGSNLVSGNEYYVHLQVYSEKTGWSDVSVKSFIMP